MPAEEGWRWSFDARLQGASALKLTADHVRAVLTGLSMPGLLLLAENGLRQRGDLPELPASLRVTSVPGGHHCHMEESVEHIAAELQAFLAGAQAEVPS